MAGGDINAYLSRKYNIQQQGADTAALEARSRANLSDVQAQVLPSETAARNLANVGQASAGFGQGTLSRANAVQVPALAGSEVQQRIAAAGLSGAQTATEQYGITPNSIIDAATRARQADVTYPGLFDPNAMFGGVAPAAGGFGQAVTPNPQTRAATGAPMNNPDGTPRLSKGTARVPGQGNGTVDTQHAMLAPGEAVLNKAAAEHLGRTTIELLNAIGEQKMGDVGQQGGDVVAPGDDKQMQQADKQAAGYAKGTARVPGKAAAPAKGAAPGKPGAKAPGKPAGGPPGKGAPDASAQISPKLLAALMAGAGAPAGGMPAPGAQQPMPMPMPMTAPPQQQGM